MNKASTLCPNRETLRDFLGDRLLPETDARVGSHAQDCPTCQQVIEEILQLPFGPAGDTVPGVPGYRVEGIAGWGGTGVVYKALDLKLNRMVAIKVLSSDWAVSKESQTRWLSEAQVSASLEHPGIVPIHAVGQLDDGRPYFVMRFIEGVTLQDKLALCEDLTSQRASYIQYFLRIARTVGYAHANKVLHRDLKPSNVMLDRFDGVLVTDWGLSKVFAPLEGVQPARGMVTQHGHGTWEYMPPEQADPSPSRPIDARSDVFGLGAILLAFLTGQPPYSGSSRDEVREMAKHANLAAAHTRLDACGAAPELVQLARDCLSADPGARPADASAVAERVEDYFNRLQQQLQTAREETAAALAVAVAERKRRRQILVASAVVLVSLLLAGGAFGWGMWSRSVEQARRVRQVSQEFASATELQQQADQFALVDANEREQFARLWGAAQAAVDRGMPQLHLLSEDEQIQFTAQAETFRERATEGAALLRTATALAKISDERARVRLEDYDLSPPSATVSFGHAGLVRYPELFGELGIRVTDKDSDIGQTVESIQQHRLRRVLVMALDDWLAVAVDVANQDRRLIGRLREILNRVDPDPIATRVRNSVVGSEVQELDRLANELQRTEVRSPVVLLVAEWLVRTGRIRPALDLLKVWLDRHPNDFWAHNLRGGVLAHGGPRSAREAIGHFRAALALRPDLTFLRDNLTLAQPLGGFPIEEAVRAHEAEYQRSQDPASGLHYASALSAVGRTMEAERLAQQITDQHPTSAQAWVTLAVVFMHAGKRDLAARSVEAAIQRNPSIPLAYGLRARLRQADPIAATQDLQKAGQLAPYKPEFIFVHAHSFAQTGKHTEAIQLLETGLARWPDHPQLHKQLALSLFAQEKSAPGLRHLVLAIHCELPPQEALIAAAPLHQLHKAEAQKLLGALRKSFPEAKWWVPWEPALRRE